ncbi:MAG: nucleoside deaminase [Chloroflexota bacterium]
MTDERDRRWMQHAIDLARRAGERGDHPFGSVIVRGDALVAEGENSVESRHDPNAHAETVAIRAACHRLATLGLSGTTIYASGEPCWMCSTVIRTVGIRRVVFGLTSGWETGGYSSGFPILTARVDRFGQPPEVVADFLADQVSALLASFGWTYRSAGETEGQSP